MRDVMVDLETCGVRAGCAILSIGAVVFDHTKNKLGKEFYQVIKYRYTTMKYELFKPLSKSWKPHAYQKKGMKFLLEHASCALFLDPGLGKTLKRDVMPDVKMDARVGTYHNALDDAKNEALHQMKIMQRLDEMKELWAKNQK